MRERIVRNRLYGEGLLATYTILILVAFAPANFGSPTEAVHLGSFVSSQELPYHVGWNDYPTNITYRLDNGGSLSGMHAELSFATHGHDICVYGELIVRPTDLSLNFFFTDDTGFEDFTADGSTVRKYMSETVYVNASWNEVLPEYFMDRHVLRWYVVLSVVGYLNPLEADRTGWLFAGLDETPPEIEIVVDPQVSGSATVTVELTETNCELAHIDVWIGGTRKVNMAISGKAYSDTIPWDTTQYNDGTCVVMVNASDTGGSHDIRSKSCTIANIPTTYSGSITQIPPVNLTLLAEQFIQYVYISFARESSNPFFYASLLVTLAVTILKIRKAYVKAEKFPLWIGLLWVALLGILFLIPDFNLVAFAMHVSVLCATTVSDVSDWWTDRKTRGGQSQHDQIVAALQKQVADTHTRVSTLEKLNSETQSKTDEFQKKLVDLEQRISDIGRPENAKPMGRPRGSKGKNRTAIERAGPAEPGPDDLTKKDS